VLITSFVALRWFARRALLLAGLVLAACSVPTVAPPKLPPAVAPAPPLAGSPAAPARAAAAYVWSPQMSGAADRLRNQLAGHGVTVTQTSDQRLWLSTSGVEVFDKGRAALRSEARPWFDQVALALRGNARAEFRIVGSGDPGAQGSGAEALASDRAASARDWLVARGVSPVRVAVSGRIARASTATEWSRLDILVGERAGP
jgi:outer membrane protein OmpA-like peptidoglycan-associated protein